MKKLIVLAAIAATVVASCAKEPVSSENEGVVKEGMIPYTATVSFEGTKSYLDNNLNVVWEVNDEVAIFDGVNSDPNTFTVTKVDGTNATITGEISETAETLYGVYPFSAATSLSDGVITLDVPSAQTIEEDKFIASDALVSVTAETAVGAALTFQNAVSLLEFTIPVEGIKKVVFSGLDGDGVTGAMSINPSTRESTLTGTSSLTVTKADGFTKDASYYATVFSRTVTGVQFVLTADDYKSVVKTKTTTEADFAKDGGLKFAFNSEKITAGKFPINIKTKADLEAFAAHADLYEAGEWVTICDDIDYGEETWTTIKQFAGNIDGQSHSIYNILIQTNDEDRTGFIGKLTSGGQIKDLNLGYNGSAYDGTSKIVIPSCSTENPCVGAFVAATAGESTAFSNLNNYIPLTVSVSSEPENKSSFKIAGIVGQLGSGSKITSCKNYGAISMNHTVSLKDHAYIGGIVGIINCSNCKIENCTNEASLEGAMNIAIGGHAFMGGICGRMAGEINGIEIKGCTNNGKLNVKKNLSTGCTPFMGGIIAGDNTPVSYEEPSLSIIQCTNNGEISCAASQTNYCAVAGIISYIKYNPLIQECTNTGYVHKNGNSSKNNSHIGGIVAKDDKSNGKGTAQLIGCVNTGKIHEKKQTTNKTNSVGGIIGIAYTIDVIDCINKGEVISDGTCSAICVGGIAGIHGSNEIRGCKNYGDVKLTGGSDEVLPSVNAACGGIIGRQNDFQVSTFSDCVVNCSVSSIIQEKTETTEEVNVGGMIVGNYPEGVTPTVTYGSEENPIKVAGKFNGTQITSDNLSTYLSGATNDNAKFYAKILEE